MRTTPGQTIARADGGFVLIEVLVSALVLVIASAGVFAVLQTTTRTQAEQRHSSEAYALAQEDQARLASMRLSTLNRLDETRPVTLNNTTFQVRSRGVFINDETSTPSCGEGTSTADYVEITSVVTWPGMNSSEKAKIVSILSPSNGSLDPNHGTIAFSVKSQAQVPMPNVYVTGGSGAFSGYTDAAGCAVFTDLPAGNYLATVSGEAAGMVNVDGEWSQQEEVPVAGGDTKTANFEFDFAGEIPVNFKYRVGSTEEFKAATADSVVAFHTEMEAAKAIWTTEAVREATVEATPLYPFSSAYTLYAGSCASNNPDPNGENPAGAPAMAKVVAPAGDTAEAVTLQLPALDLIAQYGSTPLSGARVTLTDTVCKESKGNYVKRVYTTNGSGQPSSSESGDAELGLPWGTYNVCVSRYISGGYRRKRVFNVSVKDLANATPLTVNLSSGYESTYCP